MYVIWNFLELSCVVGVKEFYFGGVRRFVLGLVGFYGGVVGLVRGFRVVCEVCEFGGFL